MVKCDTPSKRWYRRNRKRAIAMTVRWAKLHPERVRQNKRLAWNRMRRAVLKALGNKCKRCGFKDWRALQIDHKRGGGVAEFRAIGVVNSWRKAVKNPRDYQVLCANCNWIKRYQRGEHKNGSGSN